MEYSNKKSSVLLPLAVLVAIFIFFIGLVGAIYSIIQDPPDFESIVTTTTYNDEPLKQDPFENEQELSELISNVIKRDYPEFANNSTYQITTTNQETFVTFDTFISRTPYYLLWDICKASTQENMKIDWLKYGDTRFLSCSRAYSEFERTGTDSYALWTFGSGLSEEEGLLIEQMFNSLQAENYTKALREAERIVALTPSAPNLWNAAHVSYQLTVNSTNSYDTLKYKNMMKDYYRKAYETDPNFAPALSSHGYWLSQSGPTNESLALLHKAQTEDPNWAYAYLNEAISYYNNDQFKEAFDAIVLAVESNPKFPDYEYIQSQYVCISKLSGQSKSSKWESDYKIDLDSDLTVCKTINNQ
jgi:tetratricopeptide (TPR) repeat protein